MKNQKLESNTIIHISHDSYFSNHWLEKLVRGFLLFN